jgi:hypothetical protein
VTSTALVQARSALPAPLDRSRLVETFLAGRNERTLAAYRADLEDFRLFAGAATKGEAASRLLAGSHIRLCRGRELLICADRTRGPAEHRAVRLCRSDHLVNNRHHFRC